MKRFLFLPLCAALLFSGCGKKEQEKNVLARFDGTVVTEQQFVRRMSALPKELQSVMLRRKKEFVEEMINEYYLAKEARRRKVQDDSEVRDLIDTANRKIVTAKLIEIEVDRKVTLAEDEALKYYESHREEFTTPLLLRVSHILLESQEAAEAVKRQLEGGADFEQLAREKSLDPSSVRGGDIGFFQKGQLIPEFEQIAFGMKKGDVSGAFKTQFGYHILKLTDRAEPSVRDFRLVKSLVEKQILNQKRVRLYETFVKKFRGNAKVEIDEKALETVLTKESGKK